MNEEKWFEYPIWYSQENYEHNEELLKYCYYKKTCENGLIKSNVGGWHSTNLKVENEDVLKNFFTFLNSKLSLLNEKFSYKFELSTLWININSFGNSNKLHVHPGALLSGVYYVKANEDQGEISFYHPLSFYNDFIFNKLGSKMVDSYVTYKPKTGKLIIFPSLLPHEVLSNSTDCDRISISFNVT
jgi:uncharacterized protein (TIGR02466 family)